MKDTKIISANPCNEICSDVENICMLGTDLIEELKAQKIEYAKAVSIENKMISKDKKYGMNIIPDSIFNI